MHENNPFQKIKDYWGSYYSTLTEGALKGLLNDMGYYFTDEGEHAGKWVHEKTGKALSDKHAMDIAYERSKRKKKTKEVDASGVRPTDKDARAQGEESTHSESLFHKDTDRLLREHIRSEYEARGIYPTSREVQETYDQIMDILEATRASERDEILAKQHGTSGTANGMILTKRKIRRDRAGNPPEDHGRPLETARQENSRQLKHLKARGVRKVSPSSPAREQSEVERDTRKLMRQGYSEKYLRLIMSNTGR